MCKEDVRIKRRLSYTIQNTTLAFNTAGVEIAPNPDRASVAFSAAGGSMSTPSNTHRLQAKVGGNWITIGTISAGAPCVLRTLDEIGPIICEALRVISGEADGLTYSLVCAHWTNALENL